MKTEDSSLNDSDEVQNPSASDEGTVQQRLAIFLALTDEVDLKESLAKQIQSSLEQFPNLSRGIEPLIRFVRNTRNPSSFLVFLDRDRDALPTLLQILSIESKAIEWLISDPDSFDWLRLSAGQSVAGEHLKDSLIQEITILDETAQVLNALHRFRKRETLRVICAYCLHDMPVAAATQQLAWIADAAINAAILAANNERKNDRRFRLLKQLGINNFYDLITVIGIGAIGGQDLDLDSPLELVFLLDSEAFQGDVNYPFLNEEILRLIQRTLDLLSHSEGCGYRVQLPFNLPANDSNVNETWPQLQLQEYQRWIQTIENQGRTWVRLSLLKSRFIAGNPILAHRFLEEYPTLVFRRFLSRADIVGIGALKRKLDREGQSLNEAPTDSAQLSIGLLQGWRREIDFLVQFLQLINGGELAQVRVANTLLAIDELARHGCLTEQERGILATTQNRLNSAILHSQLRSIQVTGSSVDCQFTDGAELTEAWTKVRQIRDHLRNEIFVDEDQPSDETDLILDPSPKADWVERLLAGYGFLHPMRAYRHLTELAKEEVAILSTRRCRHFLSIIAAQLLRKISQTPDPDLTLENLALSGRSLGGKGVLWELFSVHEPSLDLYVRLCGASPYLIGILTGNPGRIDELLDSLMLNRLPTEQQLSFMLHELCRGAEDIEPIVHSFKSARHLNVGVRDILGKESITDTHRALSDIADVCLQQTIDAQFGKLVKRFGIPTLSDGSSSRFSVVALGKLGAREPNYHSDITILTIYDGEGETRPISVSRHHESISLEHFYHQLSQKIAQSINRVGRFGRLYELRNWVASTNRNATIAWALEDFLSFNSENAGSSDSALARQQLCSARVFYGPPDFQQQVQQSISELISSVAWTLADDHAVLDARRTLELSAGERNLKRGVGGTLDVECIAQLLMLRNAAQHPGIIVAGTLEAIERLRGANILPPEDADTLRDGYNFLRSVESGLRLMNTRARHDLPESELELKRLAYVLRLATKDELVSQCENFRKQHRRLFEKYS